MNNVIKISVDMQGKDGNSISSIDYHVETVSGDWRDAVKSVVDDVDYDSDAKTAVILVDLEKNESVYLETTKTKKAK